MPDSSSAKFRKVLGHFPTGVTVVTAAADGKPVGLTIGSFTSVSLDPPLVGFLAGKASDSWPEIERAGRFCVNMLSAEQSETCWLFAHETEDKFADIEWRPSALGSPILEGVLAWIDCTIHAIVEAGDHFFVMGLVHGLEVENGGRAPMLFFQGKLGRFSAD